MGNSGGGWSRGLELCLRVGSDPDMLDHPAAPLAVPRMGKPLDARFGSFSLVESQ